MHTSPYIHINTTTTILSHRAQPYRAISERIARLFTEKKKNITTTTTQIS